MKTVACVSGGVSLVVVNPPRLRGRTIVLGSRRSMVGRGDQADHILDDPEVSRLHAAIWPADGVMWLVDLGSSNGTRLNGRRVGSAPQRLAVGDRVEFGSVSLTVGAAGEPSGRPESEPTNGRNLVLLGVGLAALGVALAGYWALTVLPDESGPAGAAGDWSHQLFPPFVPWLPAGIVLALVGVAVGVYGAVVAARHPSIEIIG